MWAITVVAAVAVTVVAVAWLMTGRSAGSTARLSDELPVGVRAPAQMARTPGPVGGGG